MDDYDSMIGSPEIQADFSEFQVFDDNCEVCAETSIINQFNPGLDLDQYSAAYISAENGWYVHGEGTSLNDVGNLMDAFDIDNHTVTNASIEQLASELQQGHGVIVGVNSQELWSDGPEAELRDCLCEAFGLDNSSYQPADHAITVTGIDVSNPDNPQVIINDSGVPNGAGATYPLDKFLDAWENSDFQYTATNNPLPTLQEAGIGDASFWGNFDWGDWIGAGVGLGTGMVVGLETGDVDLAVQGGVLVGSAVSEILSNDDFARMV